MVSCETPARSVITVKLVIFNNHLAPVVLEPIIYSNPCRLSECRISLQKFSYFVLIPRYLLKSQVPSVIDLFRFSTLLKSSLITYTKYTYECSYTSKFSQFWSSGKGVCPNFQQTNYKYCENRLQRNSSTQTIHRTILITSIELNKPKQAEFVRAE